MENSPKLTPMFTGIVTMLAAPRARATVTMTWTARSGTPAGPDTAEIPAPGPVDTTQTARWERTWDIIRICVSSGPGSRGCVRVSPWVDRRGKHRVSPPGQWALPLVPDVWPVTESWPQLSIIKQIMLFSVDRVYHFSLSYCHCSVSVLFS